MRGDPLALIDDGSRRRVSGLVDRLTASVWRPRCAGRSAAGGLVALDIEAPVPAGAVGLLRVRRSLLKDQSELNALLDAGPIVPSQQPAVAQTVPTV